MGSLECPLCCAEIFSDIWALENHLLDLCENIICPICELQFKTIKSLAWHIGKECRTETKILDPENSDTSIKLGEVEGPKLFEERNYFVISPYKESCVNEQLVITDKEKSLNANDDFMTKNGLADEFLTTKDAEDESEDHVESKLNAMCLENSLQSTTFSCSVCNVTFSSIEEHLIEFHKDESVLVDYNINTYGNQKNNESSVEEKRKVAMEEKLNSKGCFTNESNLLIWSQDEISNLMVANWDPKVDILVKSKHVASEKTIFKNINGDQYLVARENQIGSLEKDNQTNSNISKALKDGTYASKVVGANLDKEWPNSLRKYPLATFVKCNEFISNDNILYSCENKPYLFQEHRVRLLKIGGKDIPLKIPFPEEPPDSIMPSLKLATHVPDDLAGSYAVMWPCQLCGLFVYHWTDLAKHCCRSSNKYYPCTLCKKSFQTRKSLNNHYSVIHKIIQTLNGCFPCPLCSAKVQTSSHLEKHLAMHKKNDLVKCKFCENMVQKSTFSNHLKAHEKNGSLNLVCQLCNRPFKEETKLQLHTPLCHLKSVGEDDLKCQLCKTKYEDLETLRQHMLSHSIPIKPHLCTFCPKSYNRLIDKVIHERVHTKCKPHSCSECGRCFRLRHSLITHMRIHTGERPFKCLFCSRTFRTKNLQRSHTTTHSGLQQFKCKYCNKKFRFKDKLDDHENFHKKAFMCSECKRAFYSLAFATKHAESHKNGLLKYTCNMCPNMFARAAYLESHLKTKHGLDTPTSISISSQKTYEHMEGSPLYQ